MAFAAKGPCALDGGAGHVMANVECHSTRALLRIISPQRLGVTPLGVITCDLAVGETDVVKKKVTPSKPATRVRKKKATGTGGTPDQFQLCLPEGTRDQLAEAAMANGRSLHDEIIHRLTRSLERDAKQKLSDRLKAQSDGLAKFEGEIAAIVEQLRRRDD